MNCNYQGYEFGAWYLDSVCIDGYLWNADSGDSDPSGDGWVYTSGGEIPCPLCNRREHLQRHAQYLRDQTIENRPNDFWGVRVPRNHKLFWNRARRETKAYLIRNGYLGE